MRRLGALRRLINSWSLLEPVEHFLCAVSVVLHFVFERSQEERRIPAPSCSTKTAFIPTTPHRRTAAGCNDRDRPSIIFSNGKIEVGVDVSGCERSEVVINVPELAHAATPGRGRAALGQRAERL